MAELLEIVPRRSYYSFDAITGSLCELANGLPWTPYNPDYDPGPPPPPRPPKPPREPRASDVVSLDAIATSSITISRPGGTLISALGQTHDNRMAGKRHLLHAGTSQQMPYSRRQNNPTHVERPPHSPSAWSQPYHGTLARLQSAELVGTTDVNGAPSSSSSTNPRNTTHLGRDHRRRRPYLTSETPASDPTITQPGHVPWYPPRGNSTSNTSASNTSEPSLHIKSPSTPQSAVSDEHSSKRPYHPRSRSNRAPRPHFG